MWMMKFFFWMILVIYKLWFVFMNSGLNMWNYSMMLWSVFLYVRNIGLIEFYCCDIMFYCVGRKFFSLFRMKSIVIWDLIKIFGWVVGLGNCWCGELMIFFFDFYGCIRDFVDKVINFIVLYSWNCIELFD